MDELQNAIDNIREDLRGFSKVESTKIIKEVCEIKSIKL